MSKKNNLLNNIKLLKKAILDYEEAENIINNVNSVDELLDSIDSIYSKEFIDKENVTDFYYGLIYASAYVKNDEIKISKTFDLVNNNYSLNEAPFIEKNINYKKAKEILNIT